MSIILPDEAGSILLQTRKRNDIPNRQAKERSQFHLDRAEEEVRRGFPALDLSLVESRRKATATYNCHGMTFANRRTLIDDDDVVVILRDDGYHTVSRGHVIPGDIILYYAQMILGHQINILDDPPVHSGVVLGFVNVGSKEHARDNRFPLILSKWGEAGEYIHRYNICPYRVGSGDRNIRFCREHQSDR